MLYAILIAIIIVLFVLKRYREHFVMSYIWQEDQKELSFEPGPDSTGLGNRIFGTSPHTCKKGEELQDGLCYEKCRTGYNGVGPVCWAETENIGSGKPVGLEPCPSGWVNDGLICREPLRCASGWKFFTEGCSGGRLRGRLNSGGICDWPSDRGKLPDWLVDKSDPKNFRATHPDRVDGLCYKKCPANKPKRVTDIRDSNGAKPPFPYLCVEESVTSFSYGRGAGGIPPIIKFGNGA